MSGEQHNGLCTEVPFDGATGFRDPQGYPDIDELYRQQARERDPAQQEVLLQRIQQLTVERAMFAPIMGLRGLMGVGPRVAEHTINSIPMHPFPSYEDMKLKE